MKTIARLSASDRSDLFRNTAARVGLSDAIVEKDFWVCFALDCLFHRSPWKNSITFKGGTSLSKAYRLINRFSEDIDLILDWRVLGYGLNEPWDDRSKTKQDAFNKEANHRTEAFLAQEFVPAVKDALSDEINADAEIYIDQHDPQTVNFAYPRLFDGTGTLQVIRLEIGALAAWSPARMVPIISYAAEQYPGVFEQRETTVLTVTPERTFWEKATILHQEANRPEYLDMPMRYFRHYYDLFKIGQSSVRNEALKQPDLLRKVAEFKMKFYPRKWAAYETARFGTLRLVPPDYRLSVLKKDYEAMKTMFFGDVPMFDDVMNGIRQIENVINTTEV